MFKIHLALGLAALTLGAWLPAGAASGVTEAPMIRNAEPVASVTTGAATRARAEVQIRRIKTLMLSRATSTEADYDRLEKLQQDLRRSR